MSATDARSQLGERLRTYRQAAKITGTRMGELMGTSQTWVSNVENGKTRISVEQLEAWLSHASVSPEVHVDLIDLAERADREVTAWKKLYAQGWATHQKRYEEIEREAQVAKLYSVSTIPGVMQTGAYTQFILEKILRQPPSEVAAGIAARRKRQEVLHRPTSRFEVVLAEQVIRHRLGGPGVMIDQLQRLADLAKLPTVDLRIISVNTDMPVPYGTGFDLYEFPGDGESVAYIELAGSEHKEMEPETIDKLRHRFDLYRAAALKGEDAIAAIELVASELT